MKEHKQSFWKGENSGYVGPGSTNRAGSEGFSLGYRPPENQRMTQIRRSGKKAPEIRKQE